MQQFEVNVTGPFLHKPQHGGKRAHVRGHYGYVVSKAALNMVTRSLVLDLRERNIIVVAANPGFVDTEMNGHQGHIKPGDSAASMAKIVSEAPLKDSGKFFDADPTTSTTELPW
ncbi:hypothetical protein AM588_10003630 [Phytophthora nicotianae]|uniref:C-factor n=1 Tax=Phytophthora nicotianae TaxID=4792 RepID=A0A0W8CVF2_PHYNI|nr:hypothetical protein AM588_10003630 [Phytophthora nicotianae]